MLVYNAGPLFFIKKMLDAYIFEGQKVGYLALMAQENLSLFAMDQVAIARRLQVGLSPRSNDAVCFYGSAK